MIIHRNYSLAERDDYRLNVLSRIHQHNAAVPIRNGKNEVVGWKITSGRTSS
jgi:hypothetical protein